MKKYFCLTLLVTASTLTISSFLSTSSLAQIYSTNKNSSEQQQDDIAPTQEPESTVETPKKNKNQVYVPSKKQETQDESSQEGTNAPALNNLDRVVSIHLSDIAQKCPGAWTQQTCMAALANSNMTMASQYAEVLDQSGNKDSLEPLKEHCAASTAAMKIEVPAYAMKSAMIECANTIYDLIEQTGQKPHMSHYELTVGAIMCLSDDPSCANIEKTLIAIRSK